MFRIALLVIASHALHIRRCPSPWEEEWTIKLGKVVTALVDNSRTGRPTTVIMRSLCMPVFMPITCEATTGGTSCEIELRNRRGYMGSFRVPRRSREKCFISFILSRHKSDKDRFTKSTYSNYCKSLTTTTKPTTTTTTTTAAKSSSSSGLLSTTDNWITLTIEPVTFDKTDAKTDSSTTTTTTTTSTTTSTTKSTTTTKATTTTSSTTTTTSTTTTEPYPRALWGEWTSWNCAVSCIGVGPAFSQRIRLCLADDVIVRDDQCGFENEQIKDGCSGVAPCPQSCDDNMNWSEWSSCDKTCPSTVCVQSRELGCKSEPCCNQASVESRKCRLSCSSSSGDYGFVFSGDGSGVIGDDEDISYRGPRPDYNEDFTEESLPLCEDLADPVPRNLPAYSWTDWVTSEDAICSCATGMTLYTRDCVSNLAGRETVPAFYCENDCVDCWLSMKINPKCEAKCNGDDINKSLYLATTEDPVANVDSFFTDFPEAK